MKQGDIVVVSLDPTIGHEQSKTRSCVVIQCNALNQVMGTVIIAPITSKTFDKQYPNIVSIKNPALITKSNAKIEQLRCIDKTRVIKKIGTITAYELDQIKNALSVVFNIH